MFLLSVLDSSRHWVYSKGEKENVYMCVCVHICMCVYMCTHVCILMLCDKSLQPQHLHTSALHFSPGGQKVEGLRMCRAFTHSSFWRLNALLGVWFHLPHSE